MTGLQLDLDWNRSEKEHIFLTPEIFEKIPSEPLPPLLKTQRSVKLFCMSDIISITEI